MTILIEGSDHRLLVASVREEDVIWDTRTNIYYEYCGEDLEDYEKLVRMEVAR